MRPRYVTIIFLSAVLVAATLARAENLSATKIYIKDNADPAKRQIQVSSADTNIQLSEADDPGANGASVHVYSASDDFCVSLPAGGSWQSTATKRKFKDSVTKNQAQVGDGKLKIKIKSGVTFTLADDGSQGTVNVQVQFGTGTRFCLRCPGNTKDDTAKFLGKMCAAAACDPEPSMCNASAATTTTTTVSSTTSTTTTSTTTTTTSTTEPLGCCSSPGRLCTNVPQSGCDEAGGEVWLAGAVCDGVTGNCVTSSPAPGPCCEFSHGGCAGGPAVSPSMCRFQFGLPGALSTGLCLPDGTCTDTSSSKHVFVSNEEFDGNLSGIESYRGGDDTCQSLAHAAGQAGAYRAWLSDAATSPSKRFTHASIPYVLVNGTVIANDWADLTDGTLAAPIDVTESGATTGPPGNAIAWTGTNSDGSAASSNCAGWTSNAASDPGLVGAPGFTSSFWSSALAGACNSSARLYCFEQ
jgi:hypothetical protein